MENFLEVVDRGHHDHVIETMPWWLRILVGRDGHADLGAADLTAVNELYFPQFTHRGWLGNGPGHSTQHQDPDPQDEPGHNPGDDHLECGVAPDDRSDDPEQNQPIDDGVLGTPPRPVLGAIGIETGHSQRLEAFDDGGVGEAAAFAHCLQTKPAAGPFELAQQRAEKTGA